ncbi:MAG: hypothetical protein SPJ53_03100 [Lactobacillus amylovorus]|nr:hypothetical protein [Lactobacillus amylovorus]MDY5960310.1 hypothetical protein [Lactobacillus amylovorus]
MESLHQIFKTELYNKQFESYISKTQDNSIVYNLRLLKRITKYYLKMAEKNNIQILYSVKANMNSPILQTIEKAGIDGFDCASIYEYYQAKKSGMKRIYLVGDGFIKSDLEKIDFDFAQFDCSTVNQINVLKEMHPNIKVGVRLKGNSFFGITIDDLKKNEYLKDIVRLHFHADTTAQINMLLTKISKLLRNRTQIEKINLGGGILALKVLKRKDKEVLDLLNRIKELFPNATVIIEPGQLLSSSIGFLISKVIDINDGNIILNNSAFNLSSWYVPKLMTPHLPKGSSNIIGNTNWGGDIFTDNVDTTPVAIGDRMIFGLVGAYYTTTQRSLHGYSFPNEYYFKGEKNNGTKFN